MEILFDKYHPKSLLEAVRLVQSLDSTEDHNISFYDSLTNDAELKSPVLVKVDRHKRGIEPNTEILYENGFRVFVLKYPPDEDFDSFELALIVIKLWPQIIGVIRSNKKPFIYKCNWGSPKLKVVQR